MRFLKSYLSRRWPAVASGYHTYRYARDMDLQSMCETGLGFRLQGNPAMQSGGFEPHETQLLQSLAPTTELFIDVGANIGYFTCLMRSLSSSVIAIEPLGQNLQHLYANLTANEWSDVEVLPVGLGASVSLLHMYGGGTGASLLKGWSGASADYRHMIPVNTLDNVCASRVAGRRACIKIDVEGAEIDVLAGAVRVLDANPAPRWLVEICLTENHPDGLNPSYAQTFDVFFSRGYAAFSVEAGMRPVTASDVQRWVSVRRRDFGYVSFFFERP